MTTQRLSPSTDLAIRRARHGRRQQGRYSQQERLLLLGIGLFLVIQPWLTSAVGEGFGATTLNRLDDILLVGSLMFIVGRRLREGDRLFLPLLVPATVFIAAGLLSSLLGWGWTTVTFLGAYLSVKAYVIFLLAANMSWERHFQEFDSLLILLALPLAAIAAIEWFFPGLRGLLRLPSMSAVVEPRLGHMPVASIFDHPGMLASILISAALFALAHYIIQKRRRALGIAAILLIGSMMTLRLKPLLGLVGAFAFIPVLPERRSPFFQRLVIVAVVTVLVIGGVTAGLVRKQLSDYLSTETVSRQARNVLYATAATIAIERAPLGTGFGTFGSYGSTLVYSPAYDYYRINQVWGLSREKPDFITDTFWPSILGETGIIGLMAYSFVLVGMSSPAIRLALSSNQSGRRRAFALGTTFVLIQALVESAAAATFTTQPNAFLVAVPLGICWSLACRPAPRSAAVASARLSTEEPSAMPGRSHRPISENGTTATVESSPKQAIRVLMIGPGAESAGGMWSVAESIISSDIANHEFISTSSRSGAAGKTIRAVVAYTQYLAALTRRPDIVYVHFASGASIMRKVPFINTASALRIPLIVHAHGGGFLDYMKRTGNLTRSIVKDSLRKADLIVTVTKGSAHSYRELLGISSARLAVIPNSTTLPPQPVDQSAVRGDVMTFLYIGRLVRDKGVLELLAAFESALSSQPGIRLRIAGTGPLENDVRRFAERHPRNVDYMGVVTGPAKGRFLMSGQALVLPSHLELFPLSLLEGMAHGHAIITTPVGGICEAVEDGVSAVLVEPGDAVGLQRAIERLVTDDSLRRRIANGARQASLKYDTSVILGRLAEVYGVVLTRRQHPRG